MFAVQIISTLQWFSRCPLTPKIILLHWNMSFSQFFLSKCGKMFLSDQIDWMSGKTLSLAWHKTGLQKKIICRLGNPCKVQQEVDNNHLTLKMASAQVAKTSVTSNSPSHDSSYLDDHFQSRQCCCIFWEICSFAFLFEEFWRLF